ncbi:MAG: alanine racemase [Rectinemataceae bacterium]
MDLDPRARPTRAEIRLGPLRRNFARARELAGPGVKVMAVVKADAYGHGMIRVASELLAEGADYLGVAIIEEAIALREAGIAAPILVFGSPPDDLMPSYARYGVDMAIVSMAKARAAAKAAAGEGKVIRVHLKIDTGMGRIGARWDELEGFAEELSGLAPGTVPGIDVAGVFSHLATADCDLDFAREQIARFHSALRCLARRGIEPPLAHIANSAALAGIPEARFGMARPGILVYGYEPSPWMKIGVEPVMRLASRISFVKKVRAGEGLSYGLTWRASVDTTVATLPIGYGDGYSRSLSNRAQAWVGRAKAPIVGRICMDQTMIDLGPEREAAEGDEVVLFGLRNGEGMPGETLCELLGTIPYELTCMVGSRVPRVYVEE